MSEPYNSAWEAKVHWPLKNEQQNRQTQIVTTWKFNTNFQTMNVLKRKLKGNLKNI